MSNVTHSELVSRRALPADLNPAIVYLASLASGSVPAQKSALRKIAGLFGLETDSMEWGALRYQHVQFVRARLMDDYGAATANRILTALRRVLREAWRLGYIPEDEYRKMADVDPVRGSKDDVEDELTGRALSIGELTSIMSACAMDETSAGIRDSAAIALGYGLGLRRAEISKMQLADYNREKAIVTVRGGKGNKSRTLPIENGALDALNDWIGIRGTLAGPMFYGINKAGKVSSRRINVRAIDELYEKRTAQAGVSNTTFHDLRRTFVSDLFDKDIDVATISKLAGHSDPRTTLRYDRRKMDARRRAVKTLHVPYQRPKRIKH